ncbi:MAG: radical SAM protein [Candidatus Omnitrophica bacterium]|nr:radical SAM protein [Candidatus Omnitrophota bacterium]
MRQSTNLILKNNLFFPKPEVLTLEITNRCNLRCLMCTIWKEKPKRDLLLKDIEMIMESLEFPADISLTGGEPFLNPQIDEIYKYLFKLFLEKKIKAVDISTNGYSELIINFLKKNKKFLRPFSMHITLDGLEKTHNLQRGRHDAFRITVENIKQIKEILPSLGIKFTITALNYKELFAVYLLAKKLNLRFLPKLGERLSNYYQPVKLARPSIIKFSQNIKLEIYQQLRKIFLLEKEGLKKNKMLCFGLKSLLEYLKKGNLNFIKTCRTPKESLFINHKEEIFSCVYYSPIGNLKDGCHKGKYEKILNLADKGRCMGCLAYHGYLQDFNM